MELQTIFIYFLIVSLKREPSPSLSYSAGCHKITMKIFVRLRYIAFK